MVNLYPILKKTHNGILWLRMRPCMSLEIYKWSDERDTKRKVLCPKLSVGKHRWRASNSTGSWSHVDSVRSAHGVIFATDRAHKPMAARFQIPYPRNDWEFSPPPAALFDWRFSSCVQAVRHRLERLLSCLATAVHFVAICAFPCDVKKKLPSDLRVIGAVAQFEYECFALFAEKHGQLPEFNDMKRSPKKWVRVSVLPPPNFFIPPMFP